MRKWNKVIALLLAMVMAFGMTVSALADDDDAEGAAEPAPAFEVPEDADGAIVILHTNDTHGRIDGFAKLAALKAMYEAAGANVIVVDAGDHMQGTLEVNADRGKYAVELMNMVGYDLAVPGNHEFDFGYDNLVERSKEANFPYLAANIQYNGEPAFDGSKVIEAGETKIGFFGLDTPEAQTKAHPAKTVGVTFDSGEDMYEVAQAQVDELTKAECDYIIGIGHLGIDEETATTANRSIDLLEKVTGIDVFIDGHSHSTLDAYVEITNEERTVGETVITSTGEYFNNIGVITIKDDAVTTENVSTETITVAEDDAIQARAEEMKADISARYDDKKVGTTDIKLNGERETVEGVAGNRTGETNLGDLVCDALLWKAQQEGFDVVAAFANGGGIRETVDIGEITKRNTFSVLPFFNTLAVAEVTGEQLLEILEASTFCTPTPVGGFPQVAGVEYTIDVSKEYDQGDLYPGTTYYAPKSINRVSIQTVGGEEFDPEATYTIATNDFLAAGGDTWNVLKDLDAEHNKSIEVFLDEALEEYIATELKGEVTDKYAEPAGRITIVGEAPAEKPEEPAEPAALFSDVTEANWHYEFVKEMVDAGIVGGYPDGSFKPNDSVTWGAALKMVLAYTNHEDAAPVEGGSWASGYIALAKSEGLVDAEAEIDHNAVITRVEMCQLLAKALKIEASEKESTFPDTTDGYVVALAELGVIGGNPDGTFAPDGELTRAALCKILSTAPEAPAAAEPAEGEGDAAPAEGEGDEAAEPAEGEGDAPASDSDAPAEGESETPAEGETPAESTEPAEKAA